MIHIFCGYGKGLTVDKTIYPFQGNYLKLDSGFNYHYLDEGSGEPIVMVHGNPTWSIYYRRLVQLFSNRYRCIVPDHIGCGFSDKPSEKEYSYQFEQRINDLEALLDKLELKENITLIVHDWGGMIGMAYASRHPERIKRIVVLNTGAFHLPVSKKFPWQLALSRTWVGDFLIKKFNAFSLAAAYVCNTRTPLTPELKKAFMAPYNSPENRIATLRFVQDIPLSAKDSGYDIVSDVQSKLYQFNQIPVLICWGEKDFVFDLHFLEEWKKHLPNAEVHSFPDCGHYILEDAYEEVSQLIEDFLAKNPIK